ncbi:hypothetical protein MRB53_013370 [Persea americana]|uniref:Uncharacterized protein n=1 Tax=Persea americana TaxID=3435 RepID=A0ACC2K7T1_PERAE|nr:hypothetical protein MRB53_013370 [Persea americana]
MREAIAIYKGTMGTANVFYFCFANMYMSLFLLLLLCSLCPIAAESTAHGLLADSSHCLRDCGWNIRNDTRESPCCFMGKSGNEQHAKNGAYATQPRSGKTYNRKFIGSNHEYKGNQLINTSFLYNVSGEFSPSANRKDEEEYYDQLTYGFYSKAKNSERIEDLMHIDVGDGRSATHVKNNKTEVKLRILVPAKNTFPEFLKVDYEPKRNGLIATGYSVDVFKEVMDSLPYQVSCQFYQYPHDLYHDMGYYDELQQQFHLNGYDGVMGDITITSNRAKYGDFTLPYMMTGVSMIVPIVNRNKILVLSLSKGFLVWYFEHENNPEFKGTVSEQVGKTLAFSFSILVFAQKEKIKNNYLRLLLNLWIYEVFVLGTTYAAILQSTLSSNVQPTVMSMEQLIINGDHVGYQKGSYVFDLLKHKGFQEQKFKPYSSIDEYAIALSRGSHNNGVSAIIDEIPYLKVFLAKYADRYTMAGPTIRPGGFGFLFRKGSSIVPDVSRAIQEFIDGEKMTELEKKWFNSHEPNPTPTQTPQRDMSRAQTAAALLIGWKLAVKASSQRRVSLPFYDGIRYHACNENKAHLHFTAIHSQQLS